MTYPGKKAASTKPMKKRTATIPAKLWVFPESVLIRPHNNMAAEIYQEGRDMRLMMMFEGTCIKM